MTFSLFSPFFFVFFGAVLHVFSIQRQLDYINSNSTRATCLYYSAPTRDDVTGTLRRQQHLADEL